MIPEEIPAPTAETPARAPGAPVGRNLLALPLASFLNDFAWETPIQLLPLFITNVLGAGALAVGIVEGVADATSTLVKVASGILTDRTGKPRRLTAMGYGLANVSRPFLFIVTAWPGALVIRFFERVGKGLRTSARDALLADSTPPGESGRAFGLLRAADTFGAFGSMVVALVVIYLVQDNQRLLSAQTFRTLVLVATIPGLLSVAAVLLLAREVPPKEQRGLDLSVPPPMSRPFYMYVGVSCLFTMANSSDAFLMLRGQNLGATTLEVIALMAGFNLVYGLLSRPFGILSDRVDKRHLIAAGWVLYAGVYLGLALAGSMLQFAVLLVPYGVYYAATEGIGRALVADYVPTGSRGSAFGVYHGALGAGALAASIIAGLLYSRVSPAAPFYAGSVLALAAAVGLLLVNPPRRRRPAGEVRPTSSRAS